MKYNTGLKWDKLMSEKLCCLINNTVTYLTLITLTIVSVIINRKEKHIDNYDNNYDNKTTIDK